MPANPSSPPLAQPLVLMGVAGSGKTSVGTSLGARLGRSYRDGDELHPAENIAKMSRGEPLTDDDRWPWLRKVGETLATGPAVIVGCSALKRRYRDLIRATAGRPMTFVFLSGSRQVIEARMAVRRGHFMPASLVESQFAALEPPEPDESAVTVDIDQPLDALVEAIVVALEGPPR